MMTNETYRGPVVGRDGGGFVRVCGEDPAETWWVGSQWAVTAYGVERRDGTYAIEASRLREDLAEGRSWVLHVGMKGWADPDDFATAYFVACAMHGVKLSAEERAMVLRHAVDCRRYYRPRDGWGRR